MSEPNRPFTSGAALLLLLVHYGASALVLLIGDVLSDEQVGVVFFLAATAIAPLVATYVGLVRHAPNETTSAALRIELPRGRIWLHIVLGVAVGIALAPLASEVTARLMELLPKSQGTDDRLGEILTPSYQLAVVVLVYLNLLTRELWLRGLVLPRLAGAETVGSAVALVSFFDISTQPLLVLSVGIGVVCFLPNAILAVASRSTWTSVASSFTVLTVLVALGELMPSRTPVLLAGSVTLVVALVFVAWRLRAPEPMQPA